MKGISAVIAVVLILMITVALAAMAYVWFTDVFETISGSAGEAAEKTGDVIATSFSIASAGQEVKEGDEGNSKATIYVTNTGSTDMTLENVNVFIGSVLGSNQTSVGTGTMGPDKTMTFVILNSTVNNKIKCNEIVEITYGSLKQIATIVC